MKISRREGTRLRRVSKATPAQQTSSVREGIYVTFTALSVSIVLLTHAETSAWEALSVLAVTAGATVVAAFVAEFLSHLVVNDKLLSGAELRHAIRACLGALVVIVAPIALLGLSVLDVWSTSVALWSAGGVLVLTLVIITALAVRGISLRWWQRLVLLLCVAATGVGVLELQILAHG